MRWILLLLFAPSSCTDESTTCTPDQTSCGGACVFTDSDPQHCGQCNKPCGTNETCTAGVCEKAVPQVEILRDTWGVPHIYGDTAEAVMYGFGYAQAEDHLPLMSIFYLESTGQLRETFTDDLPVTPGTPEGSDRLLFIDHTTRLFRFHADPVEHWDRIDAADDPSWSFSSSSLLTAFAAGINAYVDQHRSTLPDWIPTYTPQGALAMARYLLIGRELQLLGNKAPGALNLALLYLVDAEWEWAGSNQFAVGPNKTSDGSTVVLAAPHLSFTGHSLWYEAHLSGGGFDVAGATLYGMPAIVMAHNEKVAFSFTNNAADNADLFRVTLDAQDKTKYLVDGVARSFDLVSVPVTLDGGTSHTHELAYTTLGGFRCPVVNPIGTHDFSAVNEAVVACTASLDSIHAVTQFWKMNRATDLSSFKEAMAMTAVNRWNIIYGDADGHIFYVCNSRHPRRPDGQDSHQVNNGSDSTTHWQGLLAFNELPQATDPTAGFMQNCNDSPSWVTPTFNQAIDMNAFPPDLCWRGNAGSPYLRGSRMLSLLDAKNDHTFESLEAITVDSYLLLAEEYVPRLVLWATTLINQTNDSAAVQRGLDLFSGWDHIVSTDSTQAQLFTEWNDRIREEVGSLPYPAPEETAVTNNQRLLALNALGNAVLALEADHGTAAVRYGDVHRIRRGSLDVATEGTEGALQALFLTSTDNQGYAWAGTSYHMLTSFHPDGSVRAVSHKPWGQSDNPTSPHYNDLTSVFARGEHKPFWFDRAEVEQHQESHVTLSYTP